MKKNLIMSVATRYDWNALEPFITSFARHCHGTDKATLMDKFSFQMCATLSFKTMCLRDSRSIQIISVM